jgi:hypothetical protein
MAILAKDIQGTSATGVILFKTHLILFNSLAKRKIGVSLRAGLHPIFKRLNEIGVCNAQSNELGCN